MRLNMVNSVHLSLSFCMFYSYGLYNSFTLHPKTDLLFIITALEMTKKKKKEIVMEINVSIFLYPIFIFLLSTIQI